MKHPVINCSRCGKDVWNEEHQVNQFTSSLIDGHDYSYLCYDCHKEIATPLEWFTEELKKLDSPHCDEARKIIQKYRNENNGLVHVALLEVMKNQTKYYPNYL